MNMTYLRVALYFLSPILGVIPGVTINTEAMTVLINLETAAIGLGAAGGLTALVFAKFGKK